MHFTNRSLERKLTLKIYECNASWWKRVYCWCTTQTMAESKEEKAHEEPCLTYKRCPHHSKKPLACSHFTLLICHCSFCSVDMKEMTKYLFPFFFTVWLNMGNLWLSTRSELAFRFSYVIQPAGGQCWCSEHYVAHIQKKIHCVTIGVYNELFYRTPAHTSGKVCCDYRGHGLWAIPRNTPLSLRNMTNISWLLSPKHSGVWVGIAAVYRFLPSAESLILQLSPPQKNCFYTQSLSLPLQKLPCTWLTIIFGHNFHQNSSKMLPLRMFPNNHFYLGSYDSVQENIQKIYLHICPAKLLLWWTHLPHSAWHIGLKAKGLWCLAFIVDVTLSHCH